MAKKRGEGDGDEKFEIPLNEIEEIAKGFRKRTLKTARLAGKLGFKFMKKSAGLSAKSIDKDKAVEAASIMVRELGALKGVVMKAGQLASYMPGALPPEAQKVLAQLQSQSTALGFKKVDDLIHDQFGERAHDVFSEFDTEPFAAASIGQVHRARHEGREVAVKVQYPGIEDLLEGDLKLIGKLMRLGSLGTTVDGKAVANELRDRIIDECDYHAEARNQARFEELFSALPDARVPRVVLERTTKRVITSELVDAKSFYPFCEEAPQSAKDKAGETIFRTCFQTLFQHCVYNADPHPGNYLFHDDGSVTFLDFGCIRKFDPEMIDVWKRCALAVVRDDIPGFKQAFTDLGMVAKPKKFDWDYQWRVMEYLYRPFKQKEPFTYTHEYVQESYDLMLFKNANKMTAGMPAEWLFLNRLQWGLNSVLAHLGATGRWPELWLNAITSPTEPPSWVLEAPGATQAPPEGARLRPA
jgi:predicted unusual protein kinase regulating ubiquinone biosynthesis (AarF/ABC1/UbiB family)